MAFCEYAEKVGGQCGSSAEHPANSQCIAIEKCDKDIRGHLKTFAGGFADSTLKSEAELLLARAGIFEINSSHLSMSICPKHRDKFGLRWRCQKRFCAVPPSWAPHKTTQMKGDRSVTFVQSKLIYKMTSTLVPIGSLPARLPDVCKAEVSKGDFVPCSKERRVPAERAMTEHLDEEEDEDGDEEGASSGLLSCPVDGCICTYQKYYNLERHLLFGKCKLVSEKHTLFDQAVLAYAKKIQEGCSLQPTLAVPTTTDHEECPEAPLQQGWALKVPKKASRFNDNQRQYLDAKFQIGQETGHKSDPEKVSRDMRYTRKENGQRLFQVDEFLTAQQIQGYFSRTAAKLKHATSQSAHVTDDNDLLAA
ncbi:hypothetical protein ACROYT_G032596 [Oculina patagonica]